MIEMNMQIFAITYEEEQDYFDDAEIIAHDLSTPIADRLLLWKKSQDRFS